MSANFSRKTDTKKRGDRMDRTTLVRRVPARTSIAYAVAALAAQILSPAALAAEIATSNSDVKIRWDNTVKYSAGWRVSGLDETVTSIASAVPNPNVDAGDRNFGRGLISNRLDLLSEFDLSYKDVGARVSGAAWYDDVYNKSPQAHVPSLGAPDYLGTPPGAFPAATKKLHGRKAEILDAFVYGRTELGGLPVSGRLGRFTQLYGESLFLGANGIAYAQGPIDVVKALSVPSSQFKEIGMPVGQVSGNVQLSPSVSVSAYYQFAWRKSRLPGAGSYFSFADFVGAGGDLLLVQPNPFNGNTGVAPRTADQDASNRGQWGAQLKFKPSGSGVEYGLYAAKYHEKAPVAVYRVLQNDYRFVYPENIKTAGASFTTTVGESNLAGEVSIRRDTPLGVAGHLSVVIDPAGVLNDARNPPYAVGNSVHANLSWISTFANSPLWQGASLIGEVGFNRRTSVTRGSQYLDPNTTRDAWGLRVLFEPQYFQVLPQVDMTVPISIGYAPSGRSSVSFFAPEKGGDLTIGINADYQKTWRASLQYVRFLGSAGAVGATGTSFASYKQFYSDRNFVSLSIQRTF
ncbi:DUF1302 domain-containing protein [Janthinobacterium sp. HLX7-2]|uniref:DUF1302 domain-containing protein n=1 Tax=Janthinobacterium sp. HLX7-2 TaxID=1259331 RepID=UPI003F1E68F9